MWLWECGFVIPAWLTGDTKKVWLLLLLLLLPPKSSPGA